MPVKTLPSRKNVYKIKINLKWQFYHDETRLRESGIFRLISSWSVRTELSVGSEESSTHVTTAVTMAKGHIATDYSQNSKAYLQR